MDYIESALNTRWAIVFTDNNILQPDTIPGDSTADSRYVSNQGPGHTLLWDQVDLTNGVKLRLPFSHFVQATQAAVLVGRRSGSVGDFEQITLGPGLVMHGPQLDVALANIVGQLPIPSFLQETVESPWISGAAPAPTSPSWITGSVVFGGPSGALAQDNTNFFWDDANNRLGVGRQPLLYRMEVQTSGAANQNLFAFYNSNSNAPKMDFFTNGAGDGVFRIINASEVVAIQLQAEGPSYINSGHLGIGTQTLPTGYYALILADGAAPGAMVSNTAGLYANDVGGTVRMFGIDEAGVTGALVMASAGLTSGVIPVAGTDGLLKDSTTALLIAGTIPSIVASTFEKAETGTDANVLTYTSGAADEFLIVQIAVDVSALTGTSVAVTVTWKDSNNATATSTLTFSAVGDGTINIPINSFTATNVVVSTVFVGVSTAYKISAFITRLK